MDVQKEITRTCKSNVNWLSCGCKVHLYRACTLCGYVQRWVKKTWVLSGNIFLLLISWVYTFFRQIFGLSSGTSVRGTVGLILVRKCFNCFNFYSNDKKLTWGCFHDKNKNHEWNISKGHEIWTLGSQQHSESLSLKYLLKRIHVSQSICWFIYERDMKKKIF